MPQTLTKQTVIVHIENDYEDKYHSEFDVELAAPDPSDIEQWWEDVVWPHTGDGHGENLNACYTATITSADDSSLHGQSFEWC